MQHENDNFLSRFMGSNFAIYDLNLKAAQIKNNYSVKNSINALANFIDSSRLRLSNP